jgi:hypothetical protein
MGNTQAQPLDVRRAAAADAAALTRLREVMLSDMGMLAAGADPGWRDKAEAWFAQRLDDKTTSPPSSSSTRTSAWSAARPGCATGTPRDRATPAECRVSSST